MMKKRMMTTALIFSLLFCVNAWAGKTLRQFMNQGGGSAPPHSKAFGVTSEALLKEYIIWFVETAPEPGHLKKVQFLPLPTEFDPNTGIGHVDITVKAGTPLFLPVVIYIGSAEDDYLEDEYFWGDVTLDGKQIIMPNDAYYIPPTYFEEPYAAWGTDLYLVQGIACKIIPLSVGVHEIELHSGFGEIFDPPIVYHNTWTITVVPGR